MKLTHRPPPVSRQIARDKARLKRALYQAAQNATHEASIGAQRKVKAAIARVGLGRLGGAVGQTSSKRKGQKPRAPYGTIFARGGDESRAGQALESYSKGATIRARRGNWMAFQTSAVPRTVGRRRMTPELYKKSGYVTKVGPLHFVPINSRYALLVARNVTLHPRTHQAKRAGPRAPRTRVPAKEVVVFVLIKVTRRAMRFDKDREVWKAAREMPDRIAFNLDRLLAKA